MKILVTGTAGFIGYHLVEPLVTDGASVIGLDNINDYYDVDLKFNRLRESGINGNDIAYNSVIDSDKFPGYRFVRLDLTDRENIASLFRKEKFDMVCHMAAQAGVRYSIENPHAYIDSNISGFINILEGCRNTPVKHLVFASSSSVYGLNEKMPFATTDNVDHPVSLYGATKKANELMAHTYSYLYNIPVTGLRFFTVYGPWGRPDMAPYLFASAIIEGRPIDVYNNGNMQRDFTYISDIVEGVVRVLSRPPEGNKGWDGMKPDPGSSPAPYRIYNIGNSDPVSLMDFIGSLERAIGKKAIKNMMPMQPGDMTATYADVRDLTDDTGYRPGTGLDDGIRGFIDWFLGYYR